MCTFTLLSRLQGLLFSAKVNHLIKCVFYTNTPLKRPKQETIRIFVIMYAVLQFYCKYRLPGCARRPQYRETSIAFFSDSPLTEINHFCSKRLISGLSFKQNMLYFAGFGHYTVVVKARTSSYPVG